MHGPKRQRPQLGSISSNLSRKPTISDAELGRKEGDVGFAGLDEGDGFVGLADVTDVAEAGDGLLVEAEELVEDDAVELDDVELGLAGGDVLEGRLR